MTRIGIDIGGTATKIVGVKDGAMFSPKKVKATDPVTSAFGALGKFMIENSLAIDDIDKIIITGVGSAHIKNKIYNIPTAAVDEFIAIGMGGLKLAGLESAVIVSMGTGTAVVKATPGVIAHIGGTGVGGGTLLGLSQLCLNMRDFDSIIELAGSGDLNKIDLKVGDIAKKNIRSLPPEMTAANFGKINDLASKSDIALGIINMVFESIATLALFAGRAEGLNDIVLTGNLTTVPQSRKIFSGLKSLFAANFTVPDLAEYATAFGAALSYEKTEYLTELK